MNFIESFPKELTCLILDQAYDPSLLTAKYVAKGWNNAITSFLRERIFSEYFPSIPTSNPSLDKCVITSIEESLVNRIQNFLEQLKKDNQSGRFSVVFPFNPGGTKLNLEIKKIEDVENKEFDKFDKKEVVIFMKRIASVEDLPSTSWSCQGKNLSCAMSRRHFNKMILIIQQIKLLLINFSFSE